MEGHPTCKPLQDVKCNPHGNHTMKMAIRICTKEPFTKNNNNKKSTNAKQECWNERQNIYKAYGKQKAKWNKSSFISNNFKCIWIKLSNLKRLAGWIKIHDLVDICFLQETLQIQNRLKVNWWNSFMQRVTKWEQGWQK